MKHSRIATGVVVVFAAVAIPIFAALAQAHAPDPSLELPPFPPPPLEVFASYLELTPEQLRRIRAAEEEARKALRERIHAELTPEQLEKLRELR